MAEEYCFLDLEVDVNGEEFFVLNKTIISRFSGRINTLVSKSAITGGGGGPLKLILNAFPDGPSNFETITKFCYSNGNLNLNINPLNISSLACAAHYLQIKHIHDQTQKSLQDLPYSWTWPDLLTALNHSQNLLPLVTSLGIIHRLLHSLIARVAPSCQMSPCPSTLSSSSNSSNYRLSSDTRSTESFKNTSNIRTATWWFDDLVAAAFDPQLIQMLVKSSLSRSNFDNGIISRFLFHYQKSRCAYHGVCDQDKLRIVQTVIEMLNCLDIRTVSYKSLFGLLRVALNMNSMSEACRGKLENMIGLQLDRATLDDLLVPFKLRKSSMYDVNLVLRFLKSFIGRGVCCVPLSRLKKVGSLMDLYLNEVAPDPYLKVSKFLDLITGLPDSARDTCDGMYHAVNLYLEVHTSLPEEQKMKVCNGLYYEKLTSEALNHLAQNPIFPQKSTVQAFVSQQCKLESLLQNTNQIPNFTESPLTSFGTTYTPDNEEEGSKQIVLYAKRLDLCDENEKLKTHLQGMQCRVLELENLCRKMQIHMTKVMRSRTSSSRTGSNSVPKLCS